MDTRELVLASMATTIYAAKGVTAAGAVQEAQAILSASAQSSEPMAVVRKEIIRMNEADIEKLKNEIERLNNQITEDFEKHIEETTALKRSLEVENQGALKWKKVAEDTAGVVMELRDQCESFRDQKVREDELRAELKDLATRNQFLAHDLGVSRTRVGELYEQINASAKTNQLASQEHEMAGLRVELKGLRSVLQERDDTIENLKSHLAVKKEEANHCRGEWSTWATVASELQDDIAKLRAELDKYKSANVDLLEDVRSLNEELGRVRELARERLKTIENAQLTYNRVSSDFHAMSRKNEKLHDELNELKVKFDALLDDASAKEKLIDEFRAAVREARRCSDEFAALLKDKS